MSTEVPFAVCNLMIITILVVGAGVSDADGDADAAGLAAFMAFADVGGRLEAAWSRSASTDFCHWEGVKECVNGRVTKLVVENLGLNGTFAPLTLGKLDQLRVLSLKRNSLAGPIPDLSHLQNLKNLFLNYNNFTGSFPVSIAGLHRLKVIVLSHNSLAGEIPAGLASLPRLSVLSLENNRLSGGIPAFNQSFLRFFNVCDNKLSGPIPDTLALSAFDAPSFNGNPKLCGRIVHKPCDVALPLPPLPPPPPPPPPALPMVENKKHRKLRTLLIVVGSVLGLSIILSIVIISFICNRRHDRTTAGGEKNGDEGGEIAGESDAQLSRKSKSNSKSRSPAASDIHCGSSRGSGSGSGNLVFYGEETQMYSLEDLLKATAVILGRGSLGSSYRVAIQERGLIVAVKRLKNCNSASMNRAQVDRHMEMLGNLRHPRLVSLKAYFRAKEETLVVYEYYPNGNLFSLIHGHGHDHGTQSSEGDERMEAEAEEEAEVEGKAKPLHWTSCLKIAEDIGQGMAYLHTMGVIHGNLKSSNVVIGCDFEACITDYGLSIFDGDNNQGQGEGQGQGDDSAYRAPECKYNNTRNIMTSTADVYSFGVILLEILSGTTPTQVMMNMGDLPRWVMLLREGLEEEEKEKEKVQVLLNIAMACLSPSPALRPSMRDGVMMITEARESSHNSVADPYPSHSHSPSPVPSPARWSDTIHSSPRGTDTERD